MTMDAASDLQKLLEIEQIRSLKARYFRAVDMQDWAMFESLFTTDALLEVSSPGGEIYMSLRGAKTIADTVRERLRGASSVHHGHNPEIELIDDRSATGIWAMEDRLQWADRNFHGWGHYHEHYEKSEDGWRIAESRLRRLDVANGFSPPPVAHDADRSEAAAMIPGIVALCARLRPKPGRTDEYLRHLDLELEEIRKDPHLITIFVHRGQDGDDRIMLYEIWRGTKQRFLTEEMAKPYRAAYMEAVRELIDEIEVDWWDVRSEWGSGLIASDASARG